MTKINKTETIKNSNSLPLRERISILGRHLRRKWHKIETIIYPPIARILHKRALSKVRAKKEPLNVIFMVIHESVWKFDRIYWKMKQSNDFNPIIVICPYIAQGEEIMYRDMEKAFTWFESRNYNVINSCDSGNWIDVKSQLKPDLMFFTNPHDLTTKKYLAKSFLNILSLYVPYAFPVSKYMNYYAQYNQVSHNTMWKIFTSNEMDKKIFIDYSDTKGRNVVVSGYPGVDNLIDKSYVVKDVWKKQETIKKKIIWAPHHSIEKGSPLRYSTFLKIADYMKTVAVKYSDELLFSFKPHPLLKGKLYAHSDWGKEKADGFFEFWQHSSNTQLDLSEYNDLFLTSDAIIHDSGSFLAEYLHVNKPAMYMVADDTLTERFNPFGKLAFAVCSHGKSTEDVALFIENDILNGQDLMADKRSDFVHKHLLQNKIVPSDYIFEYLKKSLGR